MSKLNWFKMIMLNKIAILLCPMNFIIKIKDNLLILKWEYINNKSINGKILINN